MQSVGEKLKRARLEKSLSLDEVYKQTKIHIRVLEALEEDRAHNFLNLIYLRGFLKNYAQFLGLDSEQLLKEYIDSQKIETPAPEVIQELEPKKPQAVNLIFVFRTVSVVALLIVFVFYFRFVLRRIAQSPLQTQQAKVDVKVIAAPAVKREDLVLQVRTKDDCWLKVKADGRVIFQKTLEKGRVERWQAKESIELRIGRPEVLYVDLNGKPINLQKAQVKRSLLITHEGIEGR
jgi:transcriptional regulator with XRE-family HTH domain